MEDLIPNGDFDALYAYGSRVYGNAQPHSDHDFVGIRESVDKGTILQGKVNIKLMGSGHYQRLLDEHRMTALECYFLPDRHILKAPKRPWRFKLDLKKLYEAVTERSEEDWNKAKLRFERAIEDASEEEKAKKSLYHSMRLLMFGVQIAERGRLTDYSVANGIFEQIMTDPNKGWAWYEWTWTPKRESLLGAFRSLIGEK